MEFDVEYDVVVVGSGASGKSAAYTIISESDLTVAILEKLPETGGTSKFAEGQCASNSSETRKRDKPDYPGELREGAHFPTYEEHVNSYIEQSHRRANYDVVKSFVKNSGGTIDMLKSLGVEYTEVGYYGVDDPHELFTFHRPDGLSARCQELLERACVNGGVDIFCSTPAKELIFDEDGTVAGVVAEDADGETMRIGARAVVLASGGFGNSPELIGKYSWMPQLETYNLRGVPTQNTGDGLRMALSAGADTSNIGALMVTACPKGKTAGSHIHGGGIQPLLWVNSNGERYCNEGVATSFANMGNTIGQLFDCASYTIMDYDTITSIQSGAGSLVGQGDYCPYGGHLERLQEEMDSSIAANDGAAFCGETIEELAEAFGADPSVFRATVDRYNELVELGIDEDFCKPSMYLKPVKTGPFYALCVIPDVLVSCGGIRVNGDMQVTDKTYHAIPGLYAVGLEASGLYGDSYNLECPGTANGFAHTSGRIAGHHVVETLKGE
ncbi:MAG: FAD-dependent oxidoreductase [Coriobacteriales bacterium]